MEDELDRLLSQFDEHELTSLLFSEDTSCNVPHPLQTADYLSLLLVNEPGPFVCSPASTSSLRFSLTDHSHLSAAKASSISAKNTAWSINIWKEWSKHRQESHPRDYNEWPIHLYIANDQQLDHWLSKFVLEAR